MEIGGNEDKSTFVYLTARRPCPSASDLDQWMVLPVVYDKSTLSQASEKNGGEMFLLAHVPTLKEMIFAHEMHEILANKYSHGSTASQQWPSSSGNKMSQSVGNEYAAGCTQQENSRMQHFLCVACGGRYRSRRHLYFHKRQVQPSHLTSKEYVVSFFLFQVHDNNAIVCNICGKPLKNQSAFIKHRKCHWGAADLPYLCSICTRGFKEKCHLVAHCRNKHHEEVDVDAEMDGQAPPEEQCF
ncbi:unnamed protein product [Toxocara canis]|uniref:C2H2-type domain-containing protein n=1 Tax=Toxocara canis TaxID=6265 RepID=A0A183V7Y6_TOXCA|nr:unnamed protein product [Toxocara canis]